MVQLAYGHPPSRSCGGLGDICPTIEYWYYDNVFKIQYKQKDEMLHLIDQAYLLIFDRTKPAI